LGVEHLLLHKDDPLIQHLLDGEPLVGLQGEWGSLASVPANTSALGSLGADLSLVALPLVIRGEILGIMLVDYCGQQHHLAGRGGKILTGIASQAAVAVENDKLQAIAAQQERMEQELVVARTIQTSFLPESYPTLPGWELAAIWRSARQVGGDFYDFIPLRSTTNRAGETQDHAGLVIADVADKGVPAALFMALSRTLMRTMAISGHEPQVTVARANNLIISDASTDLFVTLFYAVLHSARGEIEFVNAGHMPPIVLRSADGSSEELRTEGMALGVLPDIEFEQRTTTLHHGDVLLLYTDGVIEASNAGGDMFGKKRLLEVAGRHRFEPAQELVQVIDEVIAGFVGDAAQFDDFTLVVAKRQR
jgi:serine phosphatase RsbU (regulator of sigma subunit)